MDKKTKRKQPVCVSCVQGGDFSALKALFSTFRAADWTNGTKHNSLQKAKCLKWLSDMSNIWAVWDKVDVWKRQKEKAGALIWLYTDCELRLMLCVASPLPPEIWRKHEYLSWKWTAMFGWAQSQPSVLGKMVWARSNGAIMKNWPSFFPARQARKRTPRPVIWVYLCDACRRGESGAVRRSADWSFRGNQDEQRAENRPAASDGLICEGDYMTTADLTETSTCFCRWNHNVTGQEWDERWWHSDSTAALSLLPNCHLNQMALYQPFRRLLSWSRELRVLLLSFVRWMHSLRAVFQAEKDCWMLDQSRSVRDSCW